MKNKKETGILFIPEKFTIHMEIVEKEIHAGGVEGNIIYYNTKNEYLSNSLVNFIIIPDNNKRINE